MSENRSIRRVLVTGGAGLVGSHLCDRLLAAGREVIAVDDLSAGSFANVAHLKGDPRFVFIEHDVASAFEAQVDAVYHLALPSSRRSCEADPVRAAVTSVMGTVHVLEAAERNGATRIVVATSPRPCDGAHCAESLALHYVRERALDLRIVRIANPFGPRMLADDPHVVVDAVLRVLRGESLDGGGDDDRGQRLTFVDDAVDTLLRAMDAERRIPAVVAPHEEATRREVAKSVLAASGLVAPEERALAGRPRVTEPDALPAAEVFGALSPIGLDEGIAATLRWFEDRVGRRAYDRASGVYVRDAARRDGSKAG